MRSSFEFSFLFLIYRQHQLLTWSQRALVMAEKFTCRCPTKVLPWQLWSIHLTRIQKMGESQRENVKQLNMRDIINHQSLLFTSFPNVTQLHPDRQPALLSIVLLQYFTSICYFRKPKWSLSFVLLDGGLSAQALWLCRQKKKIFIRMWFLTLQCISDCWCSWLPWLTLENELLLIKWNLMIYI